MSAPPYIRMWYRDYLGDTRHLSTTEHGAYHLLIYAYWENEGPLPDDDKRLARLVGMSPRDWSKTRKTLVEFFHATGGQWKHKRIEKELAAVRGKSAKAKEAADARWAQSEGSANGMRTHTERNADAMRMHTERNANAMPVSEYQSRNTQNSGPESPPLQGGGLSPDERIAKKPRETKPDRPKVVWPKLGEEPQ